MDSSSCQWRRSWNCTLKTPQRQWDCPLVLMLKKRRCIIGGIILDFTAILWTNMLLNGLLIHPLSSKSSLPSQPYISHSTISACWLGLTSFMSCFMFYMHVTLLVLLRVNNLWCNIYDASFTLYDVIDVPFL